MSKVPCPFEVNDRIRNINDGSIAIVTDITLKGFRYLLERPQIQMRPTYGTIIGGECFPFGYNLWEKVDSVI